MSHADESPDSMAKRFFVMVILGIIVYISAVVGLISSPDEQNAPGPAPTSVADRR